jgi:hypothetical protein
MRSRKDIKANAFFAIIFAAGVLTLVSSNSFAGEAEGASTAPGGGGFSGHLSKISALKHETEDLEAETKHLIEEKREADDDAKVRALTLEIAEKYKSLKEAGEKLEAETTLVRFHFPEQAENLARKYVRFKTKSLKDLESEAGIDGRLDRVHEHVLATFPVPELEKAKNEAPKINPIFIRKPASLEDQDVPDQIVLKK